MTQQASLARYAWLSIFAAIITIALKTAAYYLTGSVGLLSDAMESIVNLVAALIALAMLIVAARPADDDHHYGHGKAEYFSSGFEGFLIFFAAIGIFLMAFDRLLHPVPLQELNIGLAISSLAGLVNFIVARILLKAGRRYHSITLEADAKHLLTDVWTSVGVLAGLAVVMFTGWQPFDPIIAFVVAIQITVSGFGLMKRSIQGLLDATLPDEENAKIDSLLDVYREQGIQFHDLCSRQAGSQRFMTVHVLVPGQMSVQEGHNLLERIESEIEEAIGEISIITHLEPLGDPASFEHGKSKHLGRACLAPKKKAEFKVVNRWMIWLVLTALLILALIACLKYPSYFQQRLEDGVQFFHQILDKLQGGTSD